MMRVLDFWFTMGNWAFNVRGTLEFHRGLDFHYETFKCYHLLLTVSKFVGAYFEFEDSNDEMDPQRVEVTLLFLLKDIEIIL